LKRRSVVEPRLPTCARPVANSIVMPVANAVAPALAMLRPVVAARCAWLAHGFTALKEQ